MKRIIIIVVVAVLWVWAELCSAQTPSAIIVPNGYTQFEDANGKPLADGTVYFYVPGTTTPKTTWQDPYQNTANSNPVVLNGSGEALIWGSGIYRQVLKDVNGNLIWDQLTGGYNCVGGGTVPLGANGAIQYNNNGVFGGLPLGTTGQVLLANSAGVATWGAVGNVPVTNITGLGTGILAALQLPEDGTGALVGENGATLNNPIINNATFNPAIGGGGITAYGQPGSVYATVLTTGWGATLGTQNYTGHPMSYYGGSWQQIYQYAAISNVDGAAETMAFYQKYSLTLAFLNTLRNPHYVDAAHKEAILMEGTTEDGQTLEFWASPHDPVDSERAIYDRVLRGHIGEGPYKEVSPKPVKWIAGTPPPPGVQDASH